MFVYILYCYDFFIFIYFNLSFFSLAVLRLGLERGKWKNVMEGQIWGYNERSNMRRRALKKVDKLMESLENEQ